MAYALQILKSKVQACVPISNFKRLVLQMGSLGGLRCVHGLGGVGDARHGRRAVPVVDVALVRAALPGTRSAVGCTSLSERRRGAAASGAKVGLDEFASNSAA